MSQQQPDYGPSNQAYTPAPGGSLASGTSSWGGTSAPPNNKPPKRWLAPTIAGVVAFVIGLVAGGAGTPEAGAGSAATPVPATPVTAPPVTVTATRTQAARPATTVTVAGAAGKVTATTTVTAAPVTKTVAAPPPSSTSDVTGVDNLKVGQSVNPSTDEWSAKVTVVSAKRQTTAMDEFTGAPKNGSFLIVQVRYECTKGSCSYNSYDWDARDGKGQTYDQEMVVSDKYRDLGAGNVTAGRTALGYVMFDVPKSAIDVEYGPLLFDNPAVWKVPAA